MLKLSFKETKVVHSKKATIVMIKAAIKPSVYALGMENIKWFIDHPFTDSLKGNVTVVGKAVCEDGDTYDPVIGERLAESRAKIKLYKFMVCLLNRVFSSKLRELWGSGTHISPVFVRKDKQSLVGTCEKYNRLLQKEKEHLEKLLKDVGYEPHSKSSK